MPILKELYQQLSDADQLDELGPVEEQIRICHAQLKAATTTATVIAPPTTQEINRKPIVAPLDGKTLELSIKELGNFDYDSDKGGDIPADIQKLDGVHFRTFGMMIPLDQADSISEFALVPDLGKGGPGYPARVQDTIVVHCPPGRAMSYDPNMLTVEGILHVKEVHDGNFIVSIFEMDASSVTPLKQ
jgi:hypothetical protein